MDRKIEKAVKEAELASRDLIQQFISILNTAEPNEDSYNKVFNKWIESKLELEKLGLKMGIGEFEFKYSVYKKIQNSQQTKNAKKLSLTAQDKKLLKSLKIIPPDEE